METHSHIEETVFYPALEKYDELRKLTREALEDHSQIKTELHQLAQAAAPSKAFDLELGSLQRDVEDHVAEEENEMFPQVLQIFGATELEQLGQYMEIAKSKFRPQFVTAKAR